MFKQTVAMLSTHTAAPAVAMPSKRDLKAAYVGCDPVQKWLGRFGGNTPVCAAETGVPMVLVLNAVDRVLQCKHEIDPTPDEAHNILIVQGETAPPTLEMEELPFLCDVVYWVSQQLQLNKPLLLHVRDADMRCAHEAFRSSFTMRRPGSPGPTPASEMGRVRVADSAAMILALEQETKKEKTEKEAAIQRRRRRRRKRSRGKQLKRERKLRRAESHLRKLKRDKRALINRDGRAAYRARLHLARKTLRDLRSGVPASDETPVQ